MKMMRGAIALMMTTSTIAYGQTLSAPGGGSSTPPANTVPNGLTGQTSFPAGTILAGNGTSPLASLTPGALGSVLMSLGPSVGPAYEPVGLGLSVSSSNSLMASYLVNAQTGTSYTIQSSDAYKLVTGANASAESYSLPSAGTAGFGVGFGFDVENMGGALSGTITITPATSTIDGASSKAIAPGFSCRITSDGTNYISSLCGTRLGGSLAEKTITYSPGPITAVTTAFSHFVKHVKSSMVDNMVASAMTFTCTTNPTVLLAECGTSTTCATPTTIASVTVTAAGTATPATISSSSITVGDYTAWEISAGACTALDISGTAEIHAN